MPSILLLGDIVIDREFSGKATRLAPEGPFPVVCGVSAVDDLGCVGNVLRNVHDFFDVVHMVTAVSPSTLPLLSAVLADRFPNVKHKNFDQLHRPLPVKNRVRANGACVARFDQEIIAPIDRSAEDAIVGYVRGLSPAPDVVIISDYAKGFVTKSLCERIISLCTQSGIPTLVDPKGEDYAKYRGCTLIKPNALEADGFFGRAVEEGDVPAFGRRLLVDLGISTVLNTLGAKGMRCLFLDGDGGIKCHSISAVPAQVVDVTGCGDAVLAAAAVLTARAGGIQGVHDGLSSLARIGGLAVAGPGCYRMTVSDWAAASVRPVTVFTNGCFDIVHFGHLKLLQRCRELGTRVVVGLNTDASIRSLKGMGRPVNTLDDRKRFLEALSTVDEVVPFSETTPLRLIRDLRPDILVKGGDYDLEQVVGREYAGRVEIVPTVSGLSTSSILDRVR